MPSRPLTNPQTIAVSAASPVPRTARTSTNASAPPVTAVSVSSSITEASGERQEGPLPALGPSSKVRQMSSLLKAKPRCQALLARATRALP